MSCSCASRTAFGGGDFARPSAETHYAPDLGLEPTHVEANLRVDLPTQRVVI